MNAGAAPRLLGIVNLTRDSFSDGGRYLAPEAAVAHARRLVAAGADIIDLGAESTHPDAEDVPADEQIARLTPVIRQLHADGITISVDTYRPEVMRRVLELGVAYINDVTALRDPQAVAAVRDSDARLILMHSCSPEARARRDSDAGADIVAAIERFFARRIVELAGAGIGRHRLILDPGMGFFLSSRPAASLATLRALPRLGAFGCPLLVSTSRKSFLGAVLADGGSPRPPDQRGPATLASELWAALHGAAYIRTHDPGALRDVLRVWRLLAT